MKKELNLDKIVDEVREAKEKSHKINVTFRLKSGVIERFKSSCEKEDVKPGAIIERLMTAFSESVEASKRK